MQRPNPGAALAQRPLRIHVPPARVRLEVGDGVECPVTHQTLGTVIELDRAANLVAVKRGGTRGREHPHNTLQKDAAKIAQSLQSGAAHVVAGTAWLWCDEALRASVDVLVVDEAGQFSLANALAVSVAAHSLVLLGDPRRPHLRTRAPPRHINSSPEEAERVR